MISCILTWQMSIQQLVSALCRLEYNTPCLIGKIGVTTSDAGTPEAPEPSLRSELREFNDANRELACTGRTIGTVE